MIFAGRYQSVQKMYLPREEEDTKKNMHVNLTLFCQERASGKTWLELDSIGEEQNQLHGGVYELLVTVYFGHSMGLFPLSQVLSVGHNTGLHAALI